MAYEIGRASGSGPVLREAAAQVQTVSPSAVVPLVRPLAIFSASLAAGVLLITGVNSGLGGAVRKAASVLSTTQAASPAAMKVVAVIEPPAYTRLQSSEATDPERLSAVQGSVVRLTVTGPAQKWRVRFGTQAKRCASGLPYSRGAVLSEAATSHDARERPAKRAPLLRCPFRRIRPPPLYRRARRDLLMPTPRRAAGPRRPPTTSPMPRAALTQVSGHASSSSSSRARPASGTR